MNKNVKYFIFVLALVICASFALVASAEVRNGDDDSIESAVVANSVSNGGDDSTGNVGDVSNGSDDGVGASGGVSNGSDDTTGGAGDVSNGGDDVTGGAGDISNGNDDVSGAGGVSNGGDDTTGGTGNVSNGSDDTTGGTGGVSNGGDDVTGGTGNVSNGEDDVTGNTGGTGNVSNGGDDTTPQGDGGTIDNGGTPNDGGNNTGSSGSGSRSSGRGGSIVLSNSEGVNISSCPLITTYMKIGLNNNPIEVTKLQAFLKTSEGMNVDVNGIFDQKTLNAVKTFQSKYLSNIMGPWDATRPSGFVYITTLKKINQLTCKTPLVLNASELAIIEAYKNNLDANGDFTTDGTIGSTANGSSTGLVLDVSSTSDNGNTNVAAVGRASIFIRFWNFLVNLFR
ncbi:MAG: peptidoglycan-binding domain-containing protein [Candidatus Paceibacterota bacterium]